MKRSASLCGRGCRSAEADAWGILRWSRCGIIGKQLPPGTAQSTIGKQLPPGKAQSTIGKRMFWQIMVPKGQVLRG